MAVLDTLTLIVVVLVLLVSLLILCLSMRAVEVFKCNRKAKRINRTLHRDYMARNKFFIDLKIK